MRMHPYRRSTIISKQPTSTHAINNDLNTIHGMDRLDDMSVSIDLSDNEHDYATSIMNEIVKQKEDDEYLSSVISIGGIDIMLRFLMYNKTLPASNKLSQDGNSPLGLRTKKYALKVLHTLLKVNTTESRQQGKKLAHDWEFLSHLLELCLLGYASHAATVLLSYLTRHHDCIVDLAKFENQLSNMTAEQLVNFCCILTPFYLVKFSTQIKDSNQAILLRIPRFLENLVNIACDVSHHMQFTVLGALSTCLRGKHQRQVCKILVEMGFINKFSKMFMAFMKNHTSYANNSPPGRMKHIIIGFALDCLQSFCEGVPSKYMLLSRAEQREVQHANEKLEEQYQDADCNNVNMLHNDKELLSYISSCIVTFQIQLSGVSYFSEMPEVLASFLRGGSHCLQMYLSRRGFLDWLVTMISSVNDPELLLSMYAVIAELVMFNPILYKELGQSLIRKQTFWIFFKKLKDKNIFAKSTRLMEALILTSDMSYDQESSDDTQCRLTEHINSYKIEYLKTLLQFISMNDTPRPMVETAMTILTTANKRKQLPQYLQELANKCSTDYSGCGLLYHFKMHSSNGRKTLNWTKL